MECAWEYCVQLTPRVRGVSFGLPFPGTRNRKLDCRFWVPTFRNQSYETSGSRDPSGFPVPTNARTRKPGTRNKFPRKDNNRMCELSIISKTSIKMDLKMGLRSLGTEPWGTGTLTPLPRVMSQSNVPMWRFCYHEPLRLCRHLWLTLIKPVTYSANQFFISITVTRKHEHMGSFSMCISWKTKTGHLSAWGCFENINIH